MASKGGKDYKGRHGAVSESEEFEEEGASTGPPDRNEIRAAFRRLPLGVHRYGPMNPPTPSARSRTALVDTIIEQLPMLTEKGLRELNMALSYELGFRGDVREHQEEQAAAARALGSGGPEEEVVVAYQGPNKV